MKLSKSDTAWLFNSDTSAVVDESDLADRLNLENIVGPVRDGHDVILTLGDDTCVVLKSSDEDVRDGETLAWNFSDDSGEWYLKVEKN